MPSGPPQRSRHAIFMPVEVSTPRALADDFARVLLELDALVGGLTDEAVAGPAGELGADGELGPHPLGVSGGRARGRRRERRLTRRQWGDGGHPLAAVGI